MSINARHAIDNERVTKSYGSMFGTIDFEPNEISKQVLQMEGNKANAGKFHIGGKEFNVTLAELDRIIETCQNAKSVFWQKFKFGV